MVFEEVVTVTVEANAQKLAASGSVENLFNQPKDHDVMRQGFEGHFADLRPVGARTDHNHRDCVSTYL